MSKQQFQFQKTKVQIKLGPDEAKWQHEYDRTAAATYIISTRYFQQFWRDYTTLNYLFDLDRIFWN